VGELVLGKDRHLDFEDLLGDGHDRLVTPAIAHSLFCGGELLRRWHTEMYGTVGSFGGVMRIESTGLHAIVISSHSVAAFPVSLMQTWLSPSVGANRNANGGLLQASKKRPSKQKHGTTKRITSTCRGV
jgi:hypothetical protein